MKYVGLPGGPPSRQKSSPLRAVAGHIVSQIRRPGRIRIRMLLLIIALFGIILTTNGGRHVTEIHFTASTLTSYIPTSITEAVGTYGENDDTRWENEGSKNDSHRIIIKKPKFHLLVPANKPTANLCKNFLSAAILNYPPPTLISYGKSPNSERPGVDVVKSTYSFLHGKEVHDNDLVLMVDGDTVFQLPAEVAISRFFDRLQDSAAQLLNKYGRVANSNLTQIPEHYRLQKYRQTVLFSSTKECSNEPSDPACYSIPQSPLPKDVYSPATDHVDVKFNRPRYMASTMVIGRVANLRPLYKRASEILEFEDDGKKGSHYVFSQIFGEQEYARALWYSAERASPPVWRSWLSSFISSPIATSVPPPNITLSPGQDHEFGIGLDYLGSVFQTMKHSLDEIKVVRFNDQPAMTAPSRIEAASYKIKHAIELPKDLSTIPPPVSRSSFLNTATNMSNTALEGALTRDATWSSVPLRANVIVPSASVPAVLNIHGIDETNNDIWLGMWYHNSTRALLTQHINSPIEPIATIGGDHWFDLRGGKGGVWTDKEEWKVWSDICGAYEEDIFGDGLGAFKIDGSNGPASDGPGSHEEDGMAKGLWEKIVGVIEGEVKHNITGEGETVGVFVQGGSAEEAKSGDDGNGNAKSIEGGKYQLGAVDEVKDDNSKSKGNEDDDNYKVSSDGDKVIDKGDDRKKSDGEKNTTQRLEVENVELKKIGLSESTDRL